MFDLQVLVPMGSRFGERIADFKKYGLVNPRSRKVLVSVLVSGESIPGIEAGWPSGFAVEVLEEDSPEYVANLYRFYTKIDPSAPRARWFVRLDDDTCTDVDGLISNLDRFYDWEFPYHMGELNDFGSARCGGEGFVYEQYKSFLGELEPFSGVFKNEIECGITSAAGLSKILGNKPSLDLLGKRASLTGGFTDCVFALAAAMAGVHPVNCPFVTHHPLLSDFSLFGGLKNHIHKISRIDKGANFGSRCSHEGFTLVMKASEAKPNKAERSLEGRRFLMERDNLVKILELKKGYIARFKLDVRVYNWYESDGELLVLNGNDVIHRMTIGDSGSLMCDGHSIVDISLAS